MAYATLVDDGPASAIWLVEPGAAPTRVVERTSGELLGLTLTPRALYWIAGGAIWTAPRKGGRPSRFHTPTWGDAGGSGRVQLVVDGTSVYFTSVGLGAVDLVVRRRERPLVKRQSIGEVFAGRASWTTPGSQRRMSLLAEPIVVRALTRTGSIPGSAGIGTDPAHGVHSSTRSRIAERGHDACCWCSGRAAAARTRTLTQESLPWPRSIRSR